MYKIIAILKGSNKDLGKFELENLWEIYNNEKINAKEVKNTIYSFYSNNYKLCEEFLHRLTYINYLGVCFENNLLTSLNEVENISLSSKIENSKTYSVRTKRYKPKVEVSISEREFAKCITKKLNNSKANLENPETEFNPIYIDKENFYFCYKIFENKKLYSLRMPKKRPVVKPYTLKSDISRGSINLLNIKEGTILDSFCGIGGILIEGIDMGFNMIGNDISWNDLRSSQKNIYYYFPKANFHLTLAETEKKFLKKESIDGIVTDIPYGKSCRKEGEDLYEKFVDNSYYFLKPGKRMIVICATFTDFEKYATKNFKLVKEIYQYINKSLIRKILVLEKS